jgi:thiamine pyrophosphate-dependent acetolactate synthase large subunit-like protein
MLNIAMQTAIAKKGVAVLVLSGDMAQKITSEVQSPHSIYECEPMIRPNQIELEQIAALLNQGKKITVFCGNGCKNAHTELMELCEALKSPMVHALRAKEWVEFDNPYDVGMTGFIGFSSGYHAMEACDTLLLLGTSFPYRQFYPTKARIIQVDIRGEQLGKRTPIDLGVVGDVKATLDALLPLLKVKEDSSHLEQAIKHYRQSRKELDDLAVGVAGKPIHPQYVAKVLDEIASDDAIFSCDVGTPTVWAARYLKMNGQRRLLGSFNHGSMANAFSQALGAQATFKSRQVIAMCGDGGFSMLMGDVLTLAQHQLPVKTIIFNNGTLGFVELEMIASGMLPFGTDLHNPNFANMAKALGIGGIRIESPIDLRDALMSALSEKGPVIVDVVVNRNELVMPPTINAEQVKGFSLFMVKAILSGKGNEVLDLAKANLWR